MGMTDDARPRKVGKIQDGERGPARGREKGLQKGGAWPIASYRFDRSETNFSYYGGSTTGAKATFLFIQQ